MGRYSQAALATDVIDPRSWDSFELTRAAAKISRTSRAVATSEKVSHRTRLACTSAIACIREFRELKEKTREVIDRTKALLHARHNQETWSDAFRRIGSIDEPLSASFGRMSEPSGRRSEMRSPRENPQLGDIVEGKDGSKRTVIAPRRIHSRVLYLEHNAVHECSEQQWRDWAHLSGAVRTARQN